MNSGTKVFLAVFAAFIGVLVVYYGVLVPGDMPTAEAGGTTPNLSIADAPPSLPTANEVHEAPAEITHEHDSQLVAGPAEGLLTESIVESGAAPTSDEGHEESNSALLAAEPAPGENSEVRPLGGLTASTEADFPLAEPEGDTRAKVPDGSKSPSVEEPSRPAAEKKSAPLANTPTSIKPESKPSPTKPQPRAPARPAAPATPTEYTIKAGDTFMSIANQWFGDETKWSLIAKANPTVDPTRLKIGQKLRLPPKDAKPEPIREATAAADERARYTVRSGDTLAKIARELYGDIAMWEVIYRANRGVIGADPSELKVGMKLTLPESTPPRTKPKSNS